jgi:hypothetical protein
LAGDAGDEGDPRNRVVYRGAESVIQHIDFILAVRTCLRGGLVKFILSTVVPFSVDFRSCWFKVPSCI